MLLLFFDSSALVKRYVNESGSSWILQLFDPMAGNLSFVASITAVEVVSALVRQARAGHISSTDLIWALSLCRVDFAGGYQIVELSPAVIERAITMAEAHALRGYDAVQLAAALEVYHFQLARGGPVPMFISSDTTLNAAASIEGLAVDDPNVHP
jgi:predicted nucleic acid-binding protein